MSRERAQAMASCQLASVGSETTGETVRSENAGLYYLGPREPLSYTSNGRSVWDSKEASVLSGFQYLRGKRGFSAYGFHRGQPCHIGVSKDSDLR